MKFKHSILVKTLLIMLIISCNSTDENLTPKEIEKIKTEVISSIEKHVKDIINQDYQKVMPFYVKDDFVLFGDGKYWGDYSTVDTIWKTWLPRWKAITKWSLKNHKVHVYSRDAAVDFVEWEHERIEETGDTTRAYGFWVWGMQRYPEGWKAINAAIDHRYTSGPNAKKKVTGETHL